MQREARRAFCDEYGAGARREIDRDVPPPFRSYHSGCDVAEAGDGFCDRRMQREARSCFATSTGRECTIVLDPPSPRLRRDKPPGTGQTGQASANHTVDCEPQSTHHEADVRPAHGRYRPVTPIFLLFPRKEGQQEKRIIGDSDNCGTGTCNRDWNVLSY